MLIGQIVNKMPPPLLRRKDDSLIDSETLLGVEIEVEGCKKKLPTRDKDAAYWEMKEDHSLRNNGMEFAFKEPLFGTDAVNAIRYLFEKAKEYGFQISDRTGIHVHVDMRGMELDKFQNFCILYALTEPALYRWIGDGRDRNIHCLPWYAADGDLDTIAAVLREPNMGPTYIRQINRYAGLNLNSLATFGTAEFRQLKTTFDYGRMMDWLNIILSIRKAALAWTGTPGQLIKEMKILKAYGFMHKVFGPYLTKLWYSEFETQFRGMSLPIAQHLSQHAVKLSLNAKNEKFERKMRNESDEDGSHAGVDKWKTKKAKARQEKGDPAKKVLASAPKSKGKSTLADVAQSWQVLYGANAQPGATFTLSTNTQEWLSQSPPPPVFIPEEPDTYEDDWDSDYQLDDEQQEDND